MKYKNSLYHPIWSNTNRYIAQIDETLFVADDLPILSSVVKMVIHSTLKTVTKDTLATKETKLQQLQEPEAKVTDEQVTNLKLEIANLQIYLSKHDRIQQELAIHIAQQQQQRMAAMTNQTERGNSLEAVISKVPKIFPVNVYVHQECVNNDLGIRDFEIWKMDQTKQLMFKMSESDLLNVQRPISMTIRSGFDSDLICLATGIGTPYDSIVSPDFFPRMHRLDGGKEWTSLNDLEMVECLGKIFELPEFAPYELRKQFQLIKDAKIEVEGRKSSGGPNVNSTQNSVDTKIVYFKEWESHLQDFIESQKPLHQNEQDQKSFGMWCDMATKLSANGEGGPENVLLPVNSSQSAREALIVPIFNNIGRLARPQSAYTNCFITNDQPPKIKISATEHGPVTQEMIAEIKSIGIDNSEIVEKYQRNARLMINQSDKDFNNPKWKTVDQICLQLKRNQREKKKQKKKSQVNNNGNDRHFAFHISEVDNGGNESSVSRERTPSVTPITESQALVTGEYKQDVSTSVESGQLDLPPLENEPNPKMAPTAPSSEKEPNGKLPPPLEVISPPPPKTISKVAKSQEHESIVPPPPKTISQVDKSKVPPPLAGKTISQVDKSKEHESIVPPPKVKGKGSPNKQTTSKVETVNGGGSPSVLARLEEHLGLSSVETVDIQPAPMYRGLSTMNARPHHTATRRRRLSTMNARRGLATMSVSTKSVRRDRRTKQLATMSVRPHYTATKVRTVETARARKSKGATTTGKRATVHSMRTDASARRPRTNSAPRPDNREKSKSLDTPPARAVSGSNSSNNSNSSFSSFSSASESMDLSQAKTQEKTKEKRKEKTKEKCTSASESMDSSKEKTKVKSAGNEQEKSESEQQDSDVTMSIGVEVQSPEPKAKDADMARVKKKSNSSKKKLLKKSKSRKVANKQSDKGKKCKRTQRNFGAKNNTEKKPKKCVRFAPTPIEVPNTRFFDSKEKVLYPDPAKAGSKPRFEYHEPDPTGDIKVDQPSIAMCALGLELNDLEGFPNKFKIGGNTYGVLNGFVNGVWGFKYSEQYVGAHVSFAMRKDQMFKSYTDDLVADPSGSLDSKEKAKRLKKAHVLKKKIDAKKPFDPYLRMWKKLPYATINPDNKES